MAVYFLAVDGMRLVKIGVADAGVEHRVDGIANMSPVPLRLLGYCEGSYDLEGKLHRLHAGDRAHGEWFVRTAAVEATMEKYLKCRPVPEGDLVKPSGADRPGARLISAPSRPEQTPKYATRKQLAEMISRDYFPVSARSLERWPMQVRHGNGYALYEVAEAQALASRKLAEARVYKAA